MYHQPPHRTLPPWRGWEDWGVLAPHRSGVLSPSPLQSHPLVGLGDPPHPKTTVGPHRWVQGSAAAGGFYLPWVQWVGRRCPWLCPPARRQWGPPTKPLPAQHQLRTVPPQRAGGFYAPARGVETWGLEHGPLPRPAFVP